MRILLLGYTGLEPNLGAQATSNGLLKLLNYSGASYIDKIPLNYIPEQIYCMHSGFFKKESKKAINSLTSRVLNKIKRRSNFKERQATRKTNIDAFLDTSNRIIREELDIITRIKLSEKVVVNGEGIIHHNSCKALSLLSLAYVAKKVGKRVEVVNCTIQEIEEEILKTVLKACDLVSVREPRSFQYLQNLGINCKLSGDCAFVANHVFGLNPPSLPKTLEGLSPCIISLGVSGQKFDLDLINKNLNDQGYSPLYFTFAQSDLPRVEKCCNIGIPVVPINSVSWQEMVEYIRQVKLVISGRHHLNIFSLIAQVPFIPLASNTWKIEGTCEMFDWPIPVLRNNSDLNQIGEYLNNQSEFKERMNMSFKKVSELQAVTKGNHY